MDCPPPEVMIDQPVAYASVSLVTLVLIGPLVFWLLPKFILFLVREIRLHRAIKEAIALAGDDRLLELLNTISALGNSEPRGCLLHRTLSDNETGTYIVRLPEGIPSFPWSGQVVKASCKDLSADDPVEFSFLDDARAEDTLMPKVFWPPRVSTPGQKAKHIHSPSRLLKLSPEVKQFAENAFPRDPVRFLESVFREFGLLDYSVRIGLHPEWVQGYRSVRCTECSAPLRLILQIPGCEIHTKLGAFVFYHFGCERHPHITQSAWDVW